MRACNLTKCARACVRAVLCGASVRAIRHDDEDCCCCYFPPRKVCRRVLTPETTTNRLQNNATQKDDTLRAYEARGKHSHTNSAISIAHIYIHVL